MVTRIMLLLMLGFGLQGCSTAPPSHVLIAISGQQFILEIVRDISLYFQKLANDPFG